MSKNNYKDKNHKKRELWIMQKLNRLNVIQLWGYYYTKGRENKLKASKNDINLNSIMIIFQKHYFI